MDNRERSCILKDDDNNLICKFYFRKTANCCGAVTLYDWYFYPNGTISGRWDLKITDYKKIAKFINYSYALNSKYENIGRSGVFIIASNDQHILHTLCTKYLKMKKCFTWKNRLTNNTLTLYALKRKVHKTVNFTQI